MVDWTAPDVQLFSGHVALYLSAISTGIYLWEFALSLEFDWQFLTLKRPFRWTLIPYLIARYVGLASFLLSIYGGNLFRPVSHCKLWAQFIYAGAHITCAAATFLLVLRVIAISNRTPWVTFLLVSFWLADCGTLIYTFAKIDGIYVAGLLACAPAVTVQSRPSAAASFAVDFVCLALVLFLLCRSRGMELWNLLVSQGIIYFVVVMVAYLTPMVLLLLNLNDGVNLSFQCLALTALVICATRMYRALATFSERENDTFTMTSARLSWNREQAATGRGDRVRTIVIPREVDTPSELHAVAKVDDVFGSAKTMA